MKKLGAAASVLAVNWAACTSPAIEMSTDPTVTCNPSIIATPVGTAAAGALVALDVQTNCDLPNEEVKIWLQRPSGAWEILHDYPGTGAGIYDWQTTAGTASGFYTIQAWARNAGSAAAYDGVATLSNYEITGGGTDCSAVTLSVSPEATSPTGPTVTLSAGVECQAPEFQYWVKAPDNSWSAPCGSSYISSPSCAWDTSDATPGTYELQVWARTQGGSALEGAAVASYSLTQGADGCYGVALSAETGNAGDTLTLTADPQCIGASEHRFFAKIGENWTYPCGTEYSTSTTCEWNTIGLGEGDYELQVWTRSVGSPQFFDVFDIEPVYHLGPPGDVCTVVDLTMTPASGASSGDTIGMSGNAYCGSAPAEYAFWVNTPENGWIAPCGASYSSAASCNWDSTGEIGGTYEVQVWARAQGSLASVEAFDYVSYDIAAPSAGCYDVDIVGITPDPGTPGILTTVTASATCAPETAPEYLLWVNHPLWGWSTPCSWTSSPVCSFMPDIPGTYELQVWARAQGGPPGYSYESVAIYSYTAGPPAP